MDALFTIYDSDRSGALDYKEFTVSLTGGSTLGAGGSPSKAGGSGGNDDLLERLRTKLASRGARGIIGLGK